MQPIPDTFVQLWLRDGMQWNQAGISVGTNFTSALPANPMRSALVLGANITQTIDWAFGDAVPTVTRGFASFALGQQSLIITYDMIGSALRLPLWVRAGSTGVAVTVLECSFDPHRFHEAMRLVNEFVSQSSAS